MNEQEKVSMKNCKQLWTSNQLINQHQNLPIFFEIGSD